MSQTHPVMKYVQEKGQGFGARMLNHMPGMAQEALAKALDYPYIYPDLDPFVKCLMAIQLKQGKSSFIHEDVAKARVDFIQQMKAIQGKPTPLKMVEDIRLPLHSGTIMARHYHPAPQKKLPMIMFYHGGAFMVGSLDTHDEFCRLLAVHAKVQVLSVAYPLTPEYSPLQIVQVCEDALAWAHQNSKTLKIYKNRIAVAGDSAGGNLATVVAQHSVGKSYAARAQLLLYPVLDFKSRHPSFYAYKEGLVLSEEDVNLVSRLYVENHQMALDDPLVSPTYGNLKQLPPTYVITAQHDLLHDEASIYAHKLRQHGVRVYHKNYVDQTHGFINLSPISKRAKKYVIEIARDFRKFWDKRN